jgi:hypothetical protein
MLQGVNPTSTIGRRFRDLVEVLTFELGGDLGPSEELQVRNAAGLQLTAEDLVARLARGEAIDADAITRAVNAANRALSTVRRRKADRKPSGPSVADYLAAKRGSAGAP